MHTTASAKKLLTLYAEQPLENHRGPTPDEKPHWVKDNSNVRAWDALEISSVDNYLRRYRMTCKLKPAMLLFFGSDYIKWCNR